MEEDQRVIRTSLHPKDTNQQLFHVRTSSTFPEPNKLLSRRTTGHPDCDPKHLPLKARNLSISHDRSHQEQCYLVLNLGI